MDRHIRKPFVANSLNREIKIMRIYSDLQYMLLLLYSINNVINLIITCMNSMIRHWLEYKLYNSLYI